MEYRRLGNSGLMVSTVGLGTNNFGSRADEKQSIRVLEQALDLGVNFLDTANVYSGTRSEEIIGKALKGKRDNVLIATKFGLPLGQGPNQKGGSRKNVFDSVEASLRRLDTDHIDLYQVHQPDPTTPIEETLRALDDLVHQGKVRYIGSSNFAAWQLSEAIWTSRTLNLHGFVSEQPYYNLLRRHVERELVPFCQAYGIGIIPYFPLESGFLTGKYRPGQPPEEGTRLAKTPSFQWVLTEGNFRILAQLEKFAQDREHTVGELAIAWLLANPTVSSVIAGATQPEQVVDNVKAIDWRMTSDEKKALNEITASSQEQTP
ncbi:MAG: aldo/keto reductase [Dehalococcoidia bacterium]